MMSGDNNWKINDDNNLGKVEKADEKGMATKKKWTADVAILYVAVAEFKIKKK